MYFICSEENKKIKSNLKKLVSRYFFNLHNLIFKFSNGIIRKRLTRF